MYLERSIDKHLIQWANDTNHKPLLLRGARQVGKSRAAEHLGESFKNFVKIDFEKNPEYKKIFEGNRDVRRIVAELAIVTGTNIVPGETLLFLDEIQECPEAIMSLRYFKEDIQELHVIAAGSLLEFALSEIPTFGVARIHSMFMYPMSFDEFLVANSQEALLKFRDECDAEHPLPEAIHQRLIDYTRTFMIVGGMPEVVAQWVSTNDYIKCQELQDDILLGYEADFPKYKKRVNPELLRNTLRSAAVQATSKFVYAQVRPGWKTDEVKSALDLLYMAGILIPVTRTSANGLPLGSEADHSSRKVLVMDCGLMLRLQNLTLENAPDTSMHILTASAADLVNKGAVAEMLAGLEQLKYKTPNLKHELFYWSREAKNAQAEIDYLLTINNQIVPMEVKAGQRGGMKSLWTFMREKHIDRAVRCSLENFGSFTYTDPSDNDALRHVSICPIFAISRLLSLI